jgi:adenylyltransferase/sulfurtransferase
MNLNTFNIVVVGAGALGSAFLKRISTERIGSIKIVDGDVVTQKNLINQKFYSADDVAGYVQKADAAKTALSRLGMTTHVVSEPRYIGQLNAYSILRGADLVVDATDNIKTRLIINNACSKLSIPLMIASIRKTEGFFYLINWKGACFNCLYRNLMPSINTACDEISVDSARFLSELMFNCIISFLNDHSQPPSFTTVSFETHSQLSITIKKDPNCETCEKHSYSPGSDASFVQICGDGIKFSLQHDLDIAKLAAELPNPQIKDNGNAVITVTGRKRAFISRYGDFLFIGYSENDAHLFIERLLSLGILTSCDIPHE